MRKLIVLTFITLDGIMQAPGGPKEDTSGGFKYGGWTFPYFDNFLEKVMTGQMNKPFDLLLGRKTYEIFASYWPFADINKDPIAAAINKAKKYVVSRKIMTFNWENSVLIKQNVVEKIRRIKKGKGPQLQVHGSGNLIQTLLKEDLVDELWLKTFPITLGKGKRLFEQGTIPANFKLIESKTSPLGIIVASYRSAGEVKTGSF